MLKTLVVIIINKNIDISHLLKMTIQGTNALQIDNSFCSCVTLQKSVVHKFGRPVSPWTYSKSSEIQLVLMKFYQAAVCVSKSGSFFPRFFFLCQVHKAAECKMILVWTLAGF